MEENTGIMIKLTTANYSIWKQKIEDILYYKDLHDPMEKREKQSRTTSQLTKMHRKAIGLIKQWVDISMLHHVATEIDAHTLWKNLRDLYERKIAQNKAFEIRKLVNLKY